jgi:hypothetical protein
MKKLILIFLITLPVILTAQDKKEVPKFGISFSGFVKTDIFRDSRQRYCSVRNS